MDYSPWPEQGCSLAEARERTADREIWKKWRGMLGNLNAQGVKTCSDSGSNSFEAAHQLEGKIEASLRLQFTADRLITYGRPGRFEAAMQRITGSKWTAVTKIDWEKSTAADKLQASAVYFDVRVLPALLAPCRVDLLDNYPLADTFKNFVLGDPEVEALAAAAIRLSPEHARTFVQGRCHKNGVEAWPLAFERWSMIGTVHPDPGKRSKFDDARRADPIEVVVAAEAVIHRYKALISMLRRGELNGRGLPTAVGYSDAIMRSIWSHEAFHLDAACGDVLQDNPEPKDRYDNTIRKWVGVVLQKPDTLIRTPELLPSSNGTQAVEPSGARHAAEIAAPTGDLPFTTADTLSIGSLSEALARLVFNHPTVRTLRARADSIAKEKRLVREEYGGLVVLVYGHNEPLLPVRYFEKDGEVPNVPTEPPPTPEEVAVWDEYFNTSGPPEIDAYYDEVNLRARTLITMLQDRMIVGWGHTVDGQLVQIAHTIWSHEDFYIHPPTGDIYEAGFGEMTKRWTGVILLGPGGLTSFHVKPTASDQVRSPTTQHDPASPKPSKAMTNAEARNAVYEKCLSWLVEIMRASPQERTVSRHSLWQKAQQKWPRLGERPFLNARAEAIRITGATAWGAAGAPKKNRSR